MDTNSKEAGPVSLNSRQAQILSDLMTYEGLQGRRDCLLMCLLLEQGLRVGEVVGLQVTDFDMTASEMDFYDAQEGKLQTNKLTPNTYKAASAYLEQDALTVGGLLLSSSEDGTLTDRPMSEGNINKRIAYLDKQLLGIEGFSAYDCRYYWETESAHNKIDLSGLV